MAVSDHETIAPLDDGALAWGLILGLFAGILVTLFKFPQSGFVTRRKLAQNLREKIESTVPVDPVSESLIEGKAAARRRLAEIGQKNSD